MAKASKSKAGKAKARKVSATATVGKKKKPQAVAKKLVKKAAAKPARAAKPVRAAKPAAAKPAATAAPGYHTVTPFLKLKGCDSAISFYKAALGATERMRMPGPGGVIMHAELVVGDSTVMLSEAMDQPPTNAAVHLYVPDCDASFQRAIEAGATATRPPEDMFWGDRYGQFNDPFGISWSIATHVRDVSPEEMQAAMASMPAPSDS
jgi:uncharacterized glyoxalase superfamily protein PhnB